MEWRVVDGLYSMGLKPIGTSAIDFPKLAKPKPLSTLLAFPYFF